MDIAAIGRQFGLDESQTRAALDALAPVVAAGVRRTAQSPEGLQDILSSVLTGGHGRALEDEQAVAFDNAKVKGDDILGQIFGNKDVSREVAEHASATSGVGSDILKKLLPVIATVVMGQVARQLGPASAQAGSSGGLGDILNDVLGGGQQPQSGPQPASARQQGSGSSLQEVLTQILGGGNQGQTPPDQMVARGRDALDGILGGGTNTGSAADDLLNSVESAVRGRK